MSGKVFKKLDVEIVKKIPAYDCVTIVKNIESMLGKKVVPAGSTCKATFSGDVDIVVQIEYDGKEALWSQLCEKFNHAKRLGSGFSVLYDYAPLGFVQIDIWPSTRAIDDAWCLAGGRMGGFKGRYRNILLGYLAKKKSEVTGFKVTFASPGGLGQPGKGRTSDPETILSYLDVPCDPETATSIEGIVETLVKAEKINVLIGFDDYLRNPKDHMPEQTERVISYVNTFLLDN